MRRHVPDRLTSRHSSPNERCRGRWRGIEQFRNRTSAAMLTGQGPEVVDAARVMEEQRPYRISHHLGDLTRQPAIGIATLRRSMTSYAPLLFQRAALRCGRRCHAGNAAMRSETNLSPRRTNPQPSVRHEADTLALRSLTAEPVPQECLQQLTVIPKHRGWPVGKLRLRPTWPRAQLSELF